MNAAATSQLPSGGTPYRIGLVCLGNICRSPMAKLVLTHLLQEAGLADRVEVASAGTGDWHVGEPIDERAGATLRKAGYDPDSHRARQLDADWLERDLLLAMDANNLADVQAMTGGRSDRVRLFREFDPAGPGDVPDPWYGGPEGFDEVLAIVQRTARALVERLREESA